MIYHLYAESKNNYINGLIYKTEIDSQTQKRKKKFMVTKGERGGVINWKFGINRYTLLYIK